MVELQLPEGSHFAKTAGLARSLESVLLERPQVASVATFVGRGAPRFFYNIFPRPKAPHLAQLVIRTKTLAAVNPLMDWCRQWLLQAMPGVVSVVKQLEQGPPVKAPVEIYCQGQDLESLRQVSEAIIGRLRNIPGALDIRTTLGQGVPSLDVLIDDAAAARHGLDRESVALNLLRQSYGLAIGFYRAGRDPVPILLRSPAGENSLIDELAALDLNPPGVGPMSKPLPLAGVADLKMRWQPAALEHRGGRRVVTVSAQLGEGVAFSQVFAPLQKEIAALTLPPGIDISYGGELEGSGEANQAMLLVLPWGIMLLLAILLAEFNSFRRLFIIMVTVPLAAAGVIPGLLLSGQPFGFMSLLGVISLVGIVVNNAIVLIDVIESRRQAGESVAQALESAVIRRIRPIVLTSLTTIVGLLPLAFSQTSLWPPLAWAMISGLLASTFMTLLVVPALYKIFFAGAKSVTVVRSAP